MSDGHLELNDPVMTELKSRPHWSTLLLISLFTVDIIVTLVQIIILHR